LEGGLQIKKIKIKIYKSKNRKIIIIIIVASFYLGKAAVAPLSIYCLVYIVFFLSK